MKRELKPGESPKNFIQRIDKEERELINKFVAEMQNKHKSYTYERLKKEFYNSPFTLRHRIYENFHSGLKSTKSNKERKDLIKSLENQLLHELLNERNKMVFTNEGLGYDYFSRRLSESRKTPEVQKKFQKWRKTWEPKRRLWQENLDILKSNHPWDLDKKETHPRVVKEFIKKIRKEQKYSDSEFKKEVLKAGCLPCTKLNEKEIQKILLLYKIKKYSSSKEELNELKYAFESLYFPTSPGVPRATFPCLIDNYTIKKETKKQEFKNINEEKKEKFLDLEKKYTNDKIEEVLQSVEFKPSEELLNMPNDDSLDEKLSSCSERKKPKSVINEKNLDYKNIKGKNLLLTNSELWGCTDFDIKYEKCKNLKKFIERIQKKEPVFNIDLIEELLQTKPEKLSKLIYYNTKKFKHRERIIREIQKLYAEDKGEEMYEINKYMKKMYNTEHKKVRKFLRKKSYYDLQDLEKYYFEKPKSLKRKIKKIYDDYIQKKYKVKKMLNKIEETFILPRIKINKESFGVIVKRKENKLENELYDLSVFENTAPKELEPNQFKQQVNELIDLMFQRAETLKPIQLESFNQFAYKIENVIEIFGTELLKKDELNNLKSNFKDSFSKAKLTIGYNTPKKVKIIKRTPNFWNKLNSQIDKKIEQKITNNLTKNQDSNPIITFKQPRVGKGIKDLPITEKKLEDILTSPIGVKYVSELIGHGELEFVSRQVLLPARVGIPDIIMKKKNNDLYYLIELKDQRAVPKDLMQTGSYMNYFMNYIKKHESYPLDTHQIKKIAGVLLTTALPKRNKEQFIQEAKNLGVQLRVLTEDFYKLGKEEPLKS